MKIGSFSPEMIETSDRKWTQALPSRVSVVYTGDSVDTGEGWLVRGNEGNVVGYDVGFAPYVEWDKGFATCVDPSDVSYL
jgi:hypothetical protein